MKVRAREAQKPQLHATLRPIRFRRQPELIPAIPSLYNPEQAGWFHGLWLRGKRLLGSRPGSDGLARMAR